jgi:glyoxylase-like metal-dependent hydrolase (beta-lactamase superfamily II)
LVETGNGLVLVDTGFGTEDVRRPSPRLSRFFLRLNRIDFTPRDTAIEQVKERGFKPQDVRHIVLTHLDFDHAGGIADFPHATVHVLAEELAAARHRRGFIARRRYGPAQFRATTHWQEYRTGGEHWFGFEAVRQLEGLPPELLLVPLRGHSAGHCGVAIETGRTWLLHAGDAYFNHGEVVPISPSCPAGARFYQWMMEVDGAERRQNQQRLRELAQQQGQSVALFCSHDVTELLERQRAAETAAARAP